MNREKHTHNGMKWTWILIPAQSITSCVTLDKLLGYLSLSFFFHKMSIKIPKSPLLGRLSIIIQVKTPRIMPGI